jgi:hypothetical protein
VLTLARCEVEGCNGVIAIAPSGLHKVTAHRGLPVSRMAVPCTLCEETAMEPPVVDSIPQNSQDRQDTSATLTAKGVRQ